MLKIEEALNISREISINKLIEKDSKCHEVIPGLYIGSIGAAYNLDSLD